ncbi:MAG: VOC family protein [FCB group bacterium]|jgi:predicted enzyme related to lactoylglutathione lyase
MARVVHFEIPAKDVEKVVDFYKKVFNWEITHWEGQTDYWLIKTGEAPEMGIDGAVYKSGEIMDKTVNTIAVEDINSAIDKIKSNGGQVVTKIDTIPGIGLFAYAVDVEGNSFGILQPLMG